MADDKMRAALKAVIQDMGTHAKAAKAGKWVRKAKPEPTPDPDPVVVSDVEGGPTLAGIMSTPGNSGADIAKMGSLSPEEMDEILKGAQ